MNSRTRNHYLLAASILAASCAAGPKREATINRSWPAASVLRVEVNEIDGNVSVDPTTGDQVTLSAHVTSRGVEPKRNKENDGYFISRVEGDTLHIGREHEHVNVRWGIFSREEVTVDYTLHVPANVALELRTINGRVATKGISGETAITTVNGGIDVESPGTTELAAKTVNGSVRAKFLSDFAGASLKTVNGGVSATLPPTASFTCDLSQVNGDFEASFPLSIHSNPGSRRVSGEVNGGRHELRIVTVNGDIRLENSPGVVKVSLPVSATTTTTNAPGVR